MLGDFSCDLAQIRVIDDRSVFVEDNALIKEESNVIVHWIHRLKI